MKNSSTVWYIGIAVYVLILIVVGLLGPTFNLGRSLWFWMTAGFFFSIVFPICYGLTYDDEGETWTVI